MVQSAPIEREASIFEGPGVEVGPINLTPRVVQKYGRVQKSDCVAGGLRRAQYLADEALRPTSARPVADAARPEAQVVVAPPDSGAGDDGAAENAAPSGVANGRGTALKAQGRGNTTYINQIAPGRAAPFILPSFRCASRRHHHSNQSCDGARRHAPGWCDIAPHCGPVGSDWMAELGPGVLHRPRPGYRAVGARVEGRCRVRIRPSVWSALAPDDEDRRGAPVGDQGWRCTVAAGLPAAAPAR